MAETPEKLLREAPELAPADRAALAGELLSSLDRPERVDESWPQEAEERSRACRSGELKAFPAADVLGEAEEI